MTVMLMRTPLHMRCTLRVPPLIRPHHESAMSPRSVASSSAPKELFEVSWQLFGELSRALALKVARGFDPEVIVGIAVAGVLPGATIAAILDRPFESMTVSRRYRPDASVRETPEIFGQAPATVRGKRVLLVDETCDSGDTMRLAKAAIVNAGACRRNGADRRRLPHGAVRAGLLGAGNRGVDCAAVGS
jgi:hypothetical protein